MINVQCSPGFHVRIQRKSSYKKLYTLICKWHRHTLADDVMKEADARSYM